MIIKNNGLSLKSFSGMEIGTFNLQKYDAGGHFSAIHTEKEIAPPICTEYWLL